MRRTSNKNPDRIIGANVIIKRQMTEELTHRSEVTSLCGEMQASRLKDAFCESYFEFAEDAVVEQCLFLLQEYPQSHEELAEAYEVFTLEKWRFGFGQDADRSELRFVERYDPGR